MKGLFYKEARCLWQYGKSYALLVVIFFGLAFLNNGDAGANPLWLLYPVFFVGSLPASLLSADEKDGWLVYCETLPVTRRQLVTAKYVTSAALTVVIIALVLLAALVSGQSAQPRASLLAAILPLLPVAGLGVPALMFPAIFKLGATKGRTVYIATVMIAAATCAVLMVSEEVKDALMALSPLPMIAAALVVFAASWLLSVKWFEAREL